MKIALKKHPAGLILCQISEALTDSEQELLLRGIAKFLANGKARVVVEFGAKIPEAAFQKIETALAPQAALAKKLGGEIRFVRPGGAAGQDAEAAVRDIMGAGSSATESALLKAQGEVERLQQENIQLLNQIEMLMAKVSEPSSDSQLKAAVAHYRKLAEDFEADKTAGAAATGEKAKTASNK